RLQLPGALLRAALFPQLPQFRIVVRVHRRLRSRRATALVKRFAEAGFGKTRRHGLRLLREWNRTPFEAAADDPTCARPRQVIECKRPADQIGSKSPASSWDVLSAIAEALLKMPRGAGGKVADGATAGA